jgi:DNA repair exonuclease SbcCD ATPase subunit
MSSSQKTKSTTTMLAPAELLAKLQSSKCTIAGDKGYFLPEKHRASLDALVADLKSENKLHVGVDVPGLLADCEKMKADLEHSAKYIKALKENAFANEAALEKSTEEFEAFKVSAKNSLDGLKSQLEENKKNAEEWRQYGKKLKSQIATSDISDPSDLEKLKTELTQANTNVTNAVNESQRLKKEIKEITDERSAQIKELAQLKAKALESETLLNDAKRAQAAAEAKAAELDTLKSALNNVRLSPEAEKHMGPQAAKWFKDLATTSVDNLRDQTYHLLLVAKTSRDKQVSKLEKLLQQLFDWIRKQSHKIREILRPWIKMITDDIGAGKTKTVMYYREALEALLKEHNLLIDAKTVKNRVVVPSYEYKPTLWSETKIWAELLLYRRPKRYVNSFGRMCKTAFSSVKAFVSSLWSRSSSVAKGKQPEVVFSTPEKDPVEVVDNSEPLPEDFEGFTKVTHKSGSSSSGSVQRKVGKLKTTFNPFKS